MTEYLTVTAAATRLGVNRRTVQRWARVGDVEAHRTPGGHWRVSLDVLDRELTLAGFAAEVGVHSLTARRWCVDGKVPGAHRTAGGHWRIPVGAVDTIGRAAR
jgi:excisionase family DNA binding protein